MYLTFIIIVHILLISTKTNMNTYCREKFLFSLIEIGIMTLHIHYIFKFMRTVYLFLLYIEIYFNTGYYVYIVIKNLEELHHMQRLTVQNR